MPPFVRRYLLNTDWLAVHILALLVLLVGLGIPLLIALRCVWREANCQPAEVAPTDALLVFGQRLNQTQPGVGFTRRLERAAELLREHPNNVVVISGGITRKALPSEAQVGLNYLHERGIDTHNILLEESSTNTLENIQNSQQILHTQGCVRVQLITDRYHLPRCKLIAHHCRLKTCANPADADLQLNAKTMLRLFFESLWVLWYACGVWWAKLTGNQALLALLSVRS